MSPSKTCQLTPHWHYSIDIAFMTITNNATHTTLLLYVWAIKWWIKVSLWKINQNLLSWSWFMVQKRTYVLRGLLQAVLHRSILSRPMNVAMPTPCCLRYSTHCCAVFIVSTTMWSSAAHAVDIATSYFSSIAPRSPYHITHHCNIYFYICFFVLTEMRMKLVLITSHSIIIYWLCMSRLI